jgi:hypothetical protein
MRLANLTVLAMAIVPLPAYPHSAPGGWFYDPSCCGGRDCRPIADDAVTPVPDGWRIRATGEIFRAPLVKHSPDAHFHRCSIDGKETTPTVCLYVPDQS